MKEKILTLLTLIFIATSISGFTYAHWGDNIHVRGIFETGALNIGFVEPLTCTDDETTKDIGKCECNYTDYKFDGETGKGAYNTTIIAITNAYPGYEVHCNFTLENIGTVPANITAITISDPTGTLTWNSTQNALVDGDGNPVISIIIIPELVGTILPPYSNNQVDVGIQIHIEQAAKECQAYQFQIQIAYEGAS